MSKTKKKFSAKQLRIIRFSGVLLFVGTCIVAFIFTGNDRFLKRCLANGNSVKYCNDIYDDRNLAFKDKELEREKRKKKKKELELAEQRRKELRHKKITTENYANGSYRGEFLNNKKHGKGTYYWTNGDKYIGSWKEGLRIGQGTYIWEDGSKYIGEWKDDNMHGKGTYYWTNGDKYIGEWKYDKLDGQGTYTWPNGDRYVGQWSNGERYGKGTFIYSNGMTEIKYF